VQSAGVPALFAVLGHPVAHSLSPAMHEAAFAAAGREARYLACDVQPAQLETALAGMRALGFAGASVTVPHKEAACRWADRRLPAAAAPGSAPPSPPAALPHDGQDRPLRGDVVHPPPLAPRVHVAEGEAE